MYTLFETFVGAGGSHIGFKNQNFISKFVNDINQDCLQTLIHNNKDIKETAIVDNNSIVDLKGSEILIKTKLQKGELDVFFGGIVCKGFSLAGERSPNDERNYYYHKQLELVNEIRPKISIIENVPGILNADVLKLSTPQKIRDDIDKLWQELENYKGQKAELRKKNKITKEFEEYGKTLRQNKKELLIKLRNENYLTSVKDDIFEIHKNYGYRLYFKILNSAWYGSATKRERAIFVGIRDDISIDFKFPIPEYYNPNLGTKFDFEGIDISNLKTVRTVNDAFKTINYKNKEDIDNKPMAHNKKTIERFKYIPEGDNIVNNMDSVPEELKISKFYSRGCTMRLAGDKPSPTLVPGHSNFPVHPKEHRSITVREAAAITGFPNDYKFIGTHTKRCEHVGNAVPPNLSEAIAKSCKELLDKFYECKLKKNKLKKDYKVISEIKRYDTSNCI